MEPARPIAGPLAQRAPERRVVLLGNPNTGKTSLFNRLCGIRAKTANFPGTTTDARFGKARVGELDLDVVDLPGTYSLALETPESTLVRRVLHGEAIYRRPDVAVVVVDATNLARNLLFVGQILAAGLPTVVALNMVDLARRRGLSVDCDALAAQLGCAVVPVVARSGRGLESLREAIGDAANQSTGPVWRLAGLDLQESCEVWADRVVQASLSGEGDADDSLTRRLDRAFTHPWIGVLVFGAVMGGLFWTLFTLAQLPMNLIEGIFAHVGSWVTNTLPPGPINELLAEGVVGGIAGTVVFLPQICLLFALISALEDTGYLARAAFVMDRLLCRFGLPGQAFVPLLSSHACAIPGILSTRLIADRGDRLATILVAPLMSCSARLPVYVLLTSLLFPRRPLMAALAFAGCYVLGAAAALLSALVLRRTAVAGRAQPMILELPSYKWPSIRNALQTAFEQGWAFLRTAGTVIMSICILMWWLSAYPKSPEPEAALELRARAETASSPEDGETLIARAEAIAARSEQANSFSGRLGRLAQPVFAPMGLDWQLTVGVLTSFVAREVFVSTLAVLVIDEETGGGESGVVSRLRNATRTDGRPLLDAATGAALLVFFVLAMQCLSTLVVTRRETGRWRWPLLQLGYMTAIAWTAGVVVFQGLRALGV